MIGLTWLHISDRLRKGEEEFDRRVIRAALIRDIGGRSGACSDLSMMNLIVFCGKRNIFEILPYEIEKPSGSGEEAHRKI